MEETGTQESRAISPAPAAYRALLLALLAAPVGAALVDVAVTRVLSVVVPVTLLIGIGLDWVWRLMEKVAGARGRGGAGVNTFSPAPLQTK